MPSAVLSQAIAAWYEIRRNGRTPNPMDVLMKTHVKPTSFIDLKDPQARTRIMAADFPGTGAHLTTASHADFNWNNTTGAGQSQFSIEFFRNCHERNDGANGLDRTYVAKWDDGSQCAFAVLTGGSVNQAKYLRVFLAINVAGSQNAVILCPIAWEWSHALFTFDGTQSGDLAKVRFYIDGRLVDPATYTISFNGGGAAVPAQIPNCTATLKIGRLGGAADFYARHAVSRLRLFKGRVLSGDASGGGEAGALWNNGNGHWHATLSSAISLSGLVGSWNLDEAGGSSRADSSGLGHTMAETGGTVPCSEMVMAIVDKGGMVDSYKAFQPQRPSEWGFGQAPRLNHTGINNFPALSFEFNHALRGAGPQLLDTPTCDLLELLRYRSNPINEDFSWSSADETSTDAYFFTSNLDVSGNRRMMLRLKDIATGLGDHNVVSSLNVSTATTYLSCWRCLGVGDSGSYEHRLNGVQATATPTVQNKGPRDIKNRDHWTLGCLYRSDGVSTALMDCLMGSKLAFGPKLGADEQRLLETWLATEYGIAI